MHAKLVSGTLGQSENNHKLTAKEIEDTMKQISNINEAIDFVADDQYLKLDFFSDEEIRLIRKVRNFKRTTMQSALIKKYLVEHEEMLGILEEPINLIYSSIESKASHSNSS